MKNLKALSVLLSGPKEICGDIYKGSAKWEFRRIGKAAMKELANYLDLVEVDIHFNPGGVAVSGDITLMGRDRDGKGIYVSMNKDMVSICQVLYRTIKHMKDYTGGTNHWMSFEELADIPTVIRKIKTAMYGYSDVALIADKENKATTEEAATVTESVHHPGRETGQTYTSSKKE